MAPSLGQAAEDLEATWPTVTAELAALNEDGGAYGEASAFFPPREMQRAGLRADGPVLQTTELVVRINALPDPSEVHAEAGDAQDEMVLKVMKQTCGIHSDSEDTDRMEVIVYLHSTQGGGPRERSNVVGRLGLQLRMRGGARLTRGQKKKKKTRS